MTRIMGDLTYPLKRYCSSESNSSTVTPERYIGFSSDLPSTLPSLDGSKNMDQKTGELRERRHWGTRKRRFWTYTHAKSDAQGQESHMILGKWLIEKVYLNGSHKPGTPTFRLSSKTRHLCQ
jgi:hypothetical protein